MIFIEIYSQIRIFSEFRSKKRAKTTNNDTIAIKKKVDRTHPEEGLASYMESEAVANHHFVMLFYLCNVGKDGNALTL